MQTVVIIITSTRSLRELLSVNDYSLRMTSLVNYRQVNESSGLPLLSHKFE